ncbi:MAG: hypothetical protein MZU79_00485 [Anaerotruncus sp.]|nr:hypothetical protein [Anaerotruncus sp.]
MGPQSRTGLPQARPFRGRGGRGAGARGTGPPGKLTPGPREGDAGFRRSCPEAGGGFRTFPYHEGGDRGLADRGRPGSSRTVRGGSRGVPVLVFPGCGVPGSCQGADHPRERPPLGGGTGFEKDSPGLPRKPPLWRAVTERRTEGGEEAGSCLGDW